MDHAAEQIQNILMGTSGASDAPSSLFDIVSGADSGTIHGLSKASNAWLNSQYKASIGDAGQYLLKSFANGYNSCRNNSATRMDKIDHFFVHQDVYEVLQDVLPDFIQYSSNKNTDLGVGMETLPYMGGKIHHIPDWPKDGDENYQAIGIISKQWKFNTRKGANFDVTKFYDQLPTIPAVCAQLFIDIAFTCQSPRSQWWGKGITI